nr:uncharacterized protein LOC104246894 [Ipomoea trifida]
MANVRIARFITEVAPPQLVTVMRRRRAAKMLDPIKEDESFSPKITTDTAPSCSAPKYSSASFLSATASAKPKFFFKDDAATRRPSSSSVVFGN